MADTCPIQDLKNILLATDGSEYSEGAVREAIALADSCGSHLIVLQTIEANPEYAGTAPGQLEREALAVRENLEIVKARAEAAGVSAEIISHEGESPWKFITEEARAKKAELIVMGRRGRTGMARLAMGSQTARVIGHAPCDVLVTPRAANVDCSNILVATDGSRFSLSAVREALLMAAKCSGKVTAISVARSDGDSARAQENLAAAAQEAEAAGIALDKIAPVGKPYLEIIEAAKARNAGLIVLGCHGRTGLSRLLMGSVTDRVIGYADSAVLVACA